MDVVELNSEGMEPINKTRWLNRFSLWFVPSALFICAFYAYSHTFTARYTYDAISYANQIREFERTGDGGWLAHPHHLLFNPLGYFTHQALQRTGMKLDPLLALQYMNAFFAACGLVLLYLLGIKGGFFLKKPAHPVPKATPFLALGLTLVFGSAYGYWVCATDGRVNMPALVGFIAVTGAALGMLYAPSARQSILLALLTLFATTLHQSYGLLIAGCVGAILLAHRLRWRERLLYSTLYLFAFGVGLTAVYTGVGVGVKGARNLYELQQWAFAYAHDGRWWDTDVQENLPLNLYALQHAFVSELPSSSEGEVMPAIRHRIPIMNTAVNVALGAALVFLPIACLLALYQRIKHPIFRQSWRAFLLLWMTALPFIAFFTIWNPGYFVFWMPVAGSLILYSLFMFALLHRSIQVLPAILSISAAILLAHTNLNATLLRRTNRENNPYLMLCDRLNERLSPGDLLLLTGMKALAPLDIYAPYFTELKVFSLNSEFKRAHGDVPAVVQTLRDKIYAHIESGGSVVVLDELTGQAPWRELEKRYGASQEVAQAILYGHRPVLLFRYRTTEVYEVQLKVEYLPGFSKREDNRFIKRTAIPLKTGE